MRTRLAALPPFLLILASAPCRAENADMAACSGGGPDVVAACTRLIGSTPSEGVRAAAYVFRARAEGRVGDDGAALADYGEALSLQPGQAAWWRARALHHYVRGRYGEALADQTREAALDPAPGALCRKANTEGRLGGFAGEVADARGALALPGAGTVCHKALAEGLMGSGDWSGAAREVAALAARFPDDADLPAFTRRLEGR